MIINADARQLPIADKSVQCVVTSPPYYGLRDYGVDGQIGLEQTPEEYVANLVEVFREVKRVLQDDGTLWLNLGDSYAGSRGNYGGQNRGNGKQRDIVSGSQVEQKAYEGKEHWKPPTTNNLGNGIKPKDLIGIPWMVAFALRNDGAASPAHMRDIERMISAVTESYETKDEWPDKIAAEVERLERELIDANKGGWYLRSDIIWAKPNPMPESVTDRPTKSHEYLFLLTKSAKYYYNAKAILEPAAYDGRKDTKFKGSAKYKNSGQTSARAGGERRPNIIDTKYAEKDNKVMGGGGTNWVGHSAYHGADGRELFQRDQTGIPARNKRSVWTINTQPRKEAHYAVMPEKLVEPCILAGSKPGDIVFDPFMGSGTVERVAIKLGRVGMGTELNFKYIDGIASKRTSNIQINMQFPINQESNLTQQELIK